MALTKRTSPRRHDYASKSRKALGKNRAVEVVGRIQAAVQPARFSAVKRADPNQLAGILRREHPQTVALILANLEAESSAAILEVLPEETRAEVVVRMARSTRRAGGHPADRDGAREAGVRGLRVRRDVREGSKTVAEVLTASTHHAETILEKRTSIRPARGTDSRDGSRSRT